MVRNCCNFSLTERQTIKYKTQLTAKASIPEYMRIYKSQNLTVASARNWRVCSRRGQGRRGQGRGRQDRAGQGDISKADSKSRAGRGQKSGQGILQYELATVQGRAKTQGKEKRAKIKFLV